MTLQRKTKLLNIGISGAVFLAVEAFVIAIIYTRLFN